jgi:hypothetical protein|tara:strand:+ start:592 stop:777 length:186 start_codon:yes stop_codon:yes gene_type:complete
MSGTISNNISQSSGSITAPSGGIQILASDPGSPTTGQVWYNSTTNTLKYYNGSATRTVTAS